MTTCRCAGSYFRVDLRVLFKFSSLLCCQRGGRYTGRFWSSFFVCAGLLAATKPEISFSHVFRPVHPFRILTVSYGLQFANQFAVRVLENVFRDHQKLLPVVPLADRVFYGIELMNEFAVRCVFTHSQHVVQFFDLQAIGMQVRPVQAKRNE